MSLRSEAIEQGLDGEEYDRILKILNREPTRVELGIFAALWSEHCSYKTTKIHLRTLPTKGPQVLQGPGENAGIVDLGDGLVLAFKIESHNHPSFIEPYQGAATGSGGILRDIFTMGARPIAILDSLSFGDPEHPRTPYLLHGVVGGIAGYGNCIGVPTVGGEVHFDATYNGNNLVNVMCVGTARREMIHKATARGKGNLVIYLGSRTGRDGIHGATMASEEFGAGNEERRPTVQVGDPFTEKLLLEACLEMMQEKLLVGIQDMGAAGLACSTFEMASRGGSGMELDLDRVPLRETGMNAWEIFLSESQERMLLCAEPKRRDRIFEIARKWGLDCAEVGAVTEGGRIRAVHRGETVVDMEVGPLTEGAPVCERPWRTPLPRTGLVRAAELGGVDVGEALRRLIGSPNLSSRRWIYRQYDHQVGADTVVLPGSDAAVMRIKGSNRAVAMVLDSNGRYCEADPYRGVLHVTAECLRNLACVGARGIAVTNCLNYGNPEHPEVMGQIVEGIRALGEACRFFETPVTGGNVSLYNQTGSLHIQPTPTIGMVGVLEDVGKAVRAWFTRPGTEIALLGGEAADTLYESEFARVILGRADLACPPVDLKEERALQAALLQCAAESLLLSAHDCSEGGLALALAESCLDSAEEAGVRVSLPEGAFPAAYLFGEYGGRAVVSYNGRDRARIERVAHDQGVKFTFLGQVAGRDFEVAGICRIPLAELLRRREAFLEAL